MPWRRFRKDPNAPWTPKRIRKNVLLPKLFLKGIQGFSWSHLVSWKTTENGSGYKTHVMCYMDTPMMRISERKINLAMSRFYIKLDYDITKLEWGFGIPRYMKRIVQRLGL